MKALSVPSGPIALKKISAHRVEVDEGDFLLRGDFAHGVGVAGERVGNVAGIVKGAAVHLGDEDWGCSFGACLVDVTDDEFFCNH